MKRKIEMISRDSENTDPEVIEQKRQKYSRSSLKFEVNQKTDALFVSKISGISSSSGFFPVNFELLTSSNIIFSTKEINCIKYFFSSGSYFDFSDFTKKLVRLSVYKNAQKNVSNFLRDNSSDLIDGADYFTLSKANCNLIEIPCSSNKKYFCSFSFSFLNLYVNYLNNIEIKKQKNSTIRTQQHTLLDRTKDELITKLQFEMVQVRRENHFLRNKVKSLEHKITEKNQELKKKGIVKFWIDLCKSQLKILTKYLEDNYENMSIDKLVNSFSFDSWLQTCKSLVPDLFLFVSTLILSEYDKKVKGINRKKERIPYFFFSLSFV